MNEPADEFDSESTGWLLRPTDQVTVAVLTSISLAVIIGSWVYQGGLRGRLIEIDQAPAAPITFQLDINQADWPEWTVLPGVGEAIAKRIVQSRQEAGPFRDHTDLLRVRGIGPRTLERIKPYLLPMPETQAVAGP